MKPKSHKDSTQAKNNVKKYILISLMNLDAKLSIEFLQIEFNVTSTRSSIMTKVNLLH